MRSTTARPNRPLRVGFVGTGGMGQMAHLRNYVVLDECEVVAVSELRAEVGAAVARRYGIERYYRSASRDPQGHGLGCGDLAGNGRMDIVLAKGWLEAPEKPYEEEWVRHPDFELLGGAGVPILVVDVNGDGVSDLIVGGGHSYGIDWWEQRMEGQTRRWIRHQIDPFNSQYHDLKWIDIDGDGECELVTGKRYRAHCGNDPGARDDVGTYYFKWTGESFSKQIIDIGPPRVGTGVGIHFAMADLTGNGFPDIVAPGKDGLYVFYNDGPIP